jgi:hypothetical protein
MMKQLYKPVLLTLFIPVLIIAVLLGNYYFKKNQRAYNFERKFSVVVTGLKVMDIRYNSFYMAGYTNDYLYLGNKTAPKYVLKVNTALTDSQSVHILVDKTHFKKGMYKLSVDSTTFYLMDGNNRNIIKGSTDEWLGKADTIKVPYFSQNIPLNENSMVCRFVSFKTHTNGLRKVSRTAAPITNGSILEKQVDGLFCTDGLLQYHKSLNLLSYMYFYRNQILLMDTNLHLVGKLKTIDPIDTAKFKIAKIESNQSITFSSPPLQVNANSSGYGNLLFIESKIQAKNDQDKIFKDAMVIDVYDLIKSSYLYSFYLRNYKGQKTTQFKVVGNYIFALSDQYLIRYSIKLPLG